MAVFELVFNTHSVDLGYDFTQVISLRDELGNTYQATDWSGESGGHHLSGEISFGPLSNEEQSIILDISGIDDQSASFEWSL